VASAVARLSLATTEATCADHHSASPGNMVSAVLTFSCCREVSHQAPRVAQGGAGSDQKFAGNRGNEDGGRRVEKEAVVGSQPSDGRDDHAEDCKTAECQFGPFSHGPFGHGTVIPNFGSVIGSCTS
jgi:hypothetical protein